MRFVHFFFLAFTTLTVFVAEPTGPYIHMFRTESFRSSASRILRFYIDYILFLGSHLQSFSSQHWFDCNALSSFRYTSEPPFTFSVLHQLLVVVSSLTRCPPKIPTLYLVFKHVFRFLTARLVDVHATQLPRLKVGIVNATYIT